VGMMRYFFCNFASILAFILHFLRKTVERWRFE